MFFLGWLLYGVLVGYLAKILHPGDEELSFLATVGVGVSGSFVGGGINYLLGFGTSPFAPSGVIMGVIGSVITLAVYRWWKLRNADGGPRGFFTGKRR